MGGGNCHSGERSGNSTRDKRQNAHVKVYAQVQVEIPKGLLTELKREMGKGKIGKGYFFEQAF